MFNQFVEIFMSVAWPGIGRPGRRHWDSGAGDFAWWSGDDGSTCHRLGGGGGGVWLLLCSIAAELILIVQRVDLRGTDSLFVGEGFYALKMSA